MLPLELISTPLIFFPQSFCTNHSTASAHKPGSWWHSVFFTQKNTYSSLFLPVSSALRKKKKITALEISIKLSLLTGMDERLFGKTFMTKCGWPVEGAWASRLVFFQETRNQKERCLGEVTKQNRLGVEHITTIEKVSCTFSLYLYIPAWAHEKGTLCRLEGWITPHPAVHDISYLSSLAFKFLLLNWHFILRQLFHYDTHVQIPQLAMPYFVWQNA